MEQNHYEVSRAQWISKFGSNRLKQASAKMYKHDGIYLDERLNKEFPGFVRSLGRMPIVKDLINPSEDALNYEDEVIAKLQSSGVDFPKVRLMYVDPDFNSEWEAGEFIRVEEYLGRHTIWKSISGRKSDYSDE